jgi:pilus assembly protein Flp/PilA
VKKFAANADGATAIEYALIAGLVSIMIVVWATSMGSTLNGTFTTVASALR